MKRSLPVVLIVGFLIPVLSGTGVCQKPQKTEKTEREIIQAAPQPPAKEAKEETLPEPRKAASSAIPADYPHKGGRPCTF